MSSATISHDFATGRISGAGIVERIGIELMRTAAYALAPFQFVGFSWAARIVSSVFKSDKQVQVKFADDCIFEYPYGDGYWGVLLYNKSTYAPDVEPYLKSFADLEYAFIDCGSNYGYMSVLVSSAQYGSKPSIAIEADPGNYKITAQNSKLNGNRYDHLHNAVFRESGKQVTLFGAKHEACSMLEEVGGGARAQVETLALNDLSGWLEDKGSLPTILKLDVEGVEIDVLQGAGYILKGDCLINYEEHGAEKTHEISRYLKDQLGMRLFLGDENGNAMKEITSWKQLDELKTNPRWGYDLFATSSKFWLPRLEEFGEKDRLEKQA
ncbi:MAG: FkbM family methyltransferase [Rhizobiaceae bacterium]|nr:FkbM family methyltransferase [Rhizobiaceae bacterium]